MLKRKEKLEEAKRSTYDKGEGQSALKNLGSKAISLVHFGTGSADAIGPANEKRHVILLQRFLCCCVRQQ